MRFNCHVVFEYPETYASSGNQSAELFIACFALQVFWCLMFFFHSIPRFYLS